MLFGLAWVDLCLQSQVPVSSFHLALAASWPSIVSSCVLADQSVHFMRWILFSERDRDQLVGHAVITSSEVVWQTVFVYQAWIKIKSPKGVKVLLPA